MNENLKELSKDDLISLTTPQKKDSTFFERSDLANEIISHKPNFLEKWALLVFLILLLLLVAGTHFVRYPDIVNAKAVLTGTNAPKEIIARQTGKLTTLLVTNNQTVKQGEILGWIESNADTRQVIDLSERLDAAARHLETGNPGGIKPILLGKRLHLGELQASYQVFISAWQKYEDHLVNGFFAKRKDMLYSDISSLKAMKGKISEQISITSEENSLAVKTFEMNKKLFNDKVISAEEYRQAQNILLNKQKIDPQMAINLISQDNQIRDKQKEIDQLDHDIQQQQLLFEQSLQTLRSQVSEWLLQYTIQSPAAGLVEFTLPLQPNQHLEQGKLLGYVNPPDSKFYIEIKLAQNNFGKIDTGMKVQLRFDAYPYQEVGYIPGKLSHLSNVATDSGFLGTVQLTNGLVTNQKRTVQYKAGLTAQALIITKDVSLLERLYYAIVKATSTSK
ncbi:HlyD family secretion protein [Chitinophaga caseinilytica]|uniref:HlyD family secretion protein n=1 Tax=Chitinophaga caseinilytica TaxID=2267521 RepID=UPI003C2D093F